VIASSVTSTRSIRDSTLTAVLIPSLDNLRLVLNDQAPNLVELTGAETMVPRNGHRRHPKLRMLAVAPNMHVDWLIAVKTVEKEPVWTRNAGHPWHFSIAPRSMIARSLESTKSG
jgi:hypothetical protein